MKHDPLVSFDDYLDLLRDRPVKFTAAEVGFKRGGGEGRERCGNCIHWYASPASPRQVCEIYRPVDDTSVRARDLCQFFTPDGDRYPRLDTSATLNSRRTSDAADAGPPEPRESSDLLPSKDRSMWGPHSDPDQLNQPSDYGPNGEEVE